MMKLTYLFSCFDSDNKMNKRSFLKMKDKGDGEDYENDDVNDDDHWNDDKFIIFLSLFFLIQINRSFNKKK